MEYIELVREFYSTLSGFDKKSVTMRLRRVEYLITLDTLEAYGVPNLGSRVAKKSDVQVSRVIMSWPSRGRC